MTSPALTPVPGPFPPGPRTPCTCPICKRHRRIGQIIQTGSRDDLVKLIHQGEDALMDAESDRDYYRAIVRGEWEGSEEILRRTLAKIEADKSAAAAALASSGAAAGRAKGGAE